MKQITAMIRPHRLDAVDRTLHRVERDAPGLMRALQRLGIQVERMDQMPGFDQVGRHAATHIAQPDKGDVGHSFSLQVGAPTISAIMIIYQYVNEFSARDTGHKPIVLRR